MGLRAAAVTVQRGCIRHVYGPSVEKERRKMASKVRSNISYIFTWFLIKCSVLQLDKKVNLATGRCFKGPTRFGKDLWISRFVPYTTSCTGAVYLSRFNPEKEITWRGRSSLLQPQAAMWSQDWKIFMSSQVKKVLNHNIIFLDWERAGKRDYKTTDITGSPLLKTLSLCFGLDLLQIL